MLTIFSRGERYSADVILDNDGSGFFVGDFDVDWDGSPRWHEDPSGAKETTLRLHGKSIDSWKVSGIVLPPEIIRAVPGIVLGCKAVVRYKHAVSDAVVFDVGPARKLGEGSPFLAERLGINPHHSHGGVDEQEVTYRFWPGVPAIVDGIEYQLQPYGH